MGIFLKCLVKEILVPVTKEVVGLMISFVALEKLKEIRNKKKPKEEKDEKIQYIKIIKD